MLPGPLTSCALAWAHLSRSRPTWPHGVAWEQWPPGPRSLAQWPEVPQQSLLPRPLKKTVFHPGALLGMETLSLPRAPPHTHIHLQGLPWCERGDRAPQGHGARRGNKQLPNGGPGCGPLFLGPGAGVRVPSPRRPHSVGSGGCLRVQGRPGERPKRALSRGLGSPCGGETKVTGLPGPPSCLSKFTHRPPCWTQRTGTSHSQCSLGEGWAGS